jgi:DNA-binding transcriptional regulator GbsR (MarR family)
MEKFIVHWGEMGERWGVNRTVAQIHALLYVSPAPLSAEEICETLSVARSTVSAGLRELQSWGIVKIVHVLGDRRDHFEAVSDVWAMFRLIVEGRKHRELDPTLTMLREVTENLAGSENAQLTKERLLALHDFFETLSTLYDQVQKLSTPTLVRVAKTGDIVSRVLSLLSPGL